MGLLLAVFILIAPAVAAVIVIVVWNRRTLAQTGDNAQLEERQVDTEPAPEPQVSELLVAAIPNRSVLEGNHFDIRQVASNIASVAPQMQMFPYSIVGSDLAIAAEKLTTLPDLMKRGGLTDNEYLQFKGYLNGKLSSQLIEIRDIARRGPASDLIQPARRLAEYSRRTTALADDWRQLLEYSAECISTDPPAEIDVVELHHALPKSYVDPDSQLRFWWDPLSVMSHPQRLSQIVMWIAQYIRDQSIDVDCICSLSVSGQHVATLLANELDRDGRVGLISSDNVTLAFMPRVPVPDEKIILVDSVVDTGEHLQKAVQAVRDRGALVTAAVSLAVNDLVEPGFAPGYYHAKHRLVGLFKLSQLFERWRASQPHVEIHHE